MKTLLAKLTIPLTSICLAASALGSDVKLQGPTNGTIRLDTGEDTLGYAHLYFHQGDGAYDAECVLSYDGSVGADLVCNRVFRIAGFQSGTGTGAYGVAIGATGTPFDSIYSATGSVNFASTANDATNSQTITVTGVSTTNTPAVDIGGAMPAGWDLVQAYVSATDTVTVVGRNKTGSTNDPSAVTLRALVTQF